LPVDEYRVQGRGGKGVIGARAREDDFTEQVFVASTHDDLLCFTNTGRVFRKKVYEIPQAARTARGRAIVNLLELKPGEQVRSFLPIRDFEKHGDYLVFATEQGLVKRTSLKLYRNVNRSGLIAVGLREGDRLVSVRLTSGDDHLVLVTDDGMAIRFDENDVRAMGRNAAGVKGINLDSGRSVVAMVRADDQRDLLTVCANGYGKRTPMREYLVHPEEGEPHPQKRGGKGRVDIRTTRRNGPAVAAMAVHEDDEMMLITERGMIVRTRVADVRQTGRGTQGVRVMNLREGDRLVSMARIDETLDAEAAGGGESSAGGAAGDGSAGEEEASE
jgi:DNA gyrase subunit A